MVELENILDSKIKKVRIELPHYSFSHSSSGESPHTFFVGRKQIKEKLKKLVEATTDKTGVYLVTGNRGVGKTSLVSKVINQTSFQHNSNFSKNLKYLLILLFSVAVTQFCLQKFTEKFNISASFLNVYNVCVLVCTLACALVSFFMLGWFSGYRCKIPKQNITFPKILREISISAFKELPISINLYNPYRPAQYILKIILVVSFMQIFSITSIPYITPTIAFIFYSVIVLGYMLFRFVKARVRQYCNKYKKEKLSKCDIICKCFIQVIIYEILLAPIWNYIKNHRRLYLRINFGHKLKDEKDILRLIARTLNIEYNKYLRLLKRMLPWRVMAFGFLLLFACLFSTIVKEQKFYESIKKLHLYQASSQIFLDSAYNESNDKSRLQRALDDDGFFRSEFNQAEIYLLVLDQLTFEISKRAVKVPQNFWKKKNETKENFSKIQMFFLPINYLFWLSFFLMYLLCMLLFRCNWITHFFVTNRIIKRQLERLNSDITYSTELEKSVNINSKNIGARIGAKIGTKTKKSRNVADAREIEKELQDILENVQRIPFFMCRPNIVIVFDELDKVEPGESNLEDKNQQTKASLFSIDATRERQTEILKILSNMKYFLSTVKAKFIFIAGREMYDIYLADVSERNNYIGSIFNTVIYVPSFLTDNADLEHHDITLLTEEFVCRRLIPKNNQKESCSLRDYRIYLEKEIYNDAKTKEIERKIQNIINKQNKDVEREIIALQALKDIEIERIQNIITKQNKEMEQKIIALQNIEIEHIQNIINKQSKKIVTLKNEKIKQIQNIIEELNEKIVTLKDVKTEQIQNIIEKQSKKIKKEIAILKNEKTEQIQNTIEEQSKKIKKEIVILKNEKIKQIQNTIEEQSKKIVTLKSVKTEQIQNIIDELNKKIEQKIIGELNKETEQKIQKIIAILQQFIIYLAHLSKGAPKKMIQLFESFIEVCKIDKNEEDKCLVVQRYHNSKLFLAFGYHNQFILGIIAYLITPVFNRLSESSIKERSDKLLVSSLRFIDFLFKFHKHPFSWKHLDISPEMLEINRSPALKSVTIDLLNYLAQVHINRPNFSFSDYTFNNLIADEISAMTKIDNVFSALFSFSLDEMLPLKKHYQDMLEKTQKEYQNDINSPKFYLKNKNSPKFIDAVSSLQVVLGDLHYYDDELEEAGVYYKNAVQVLSNLIPKNDDKEGKENEAMTLEQHYLYVRNMLRLGMIYENRKQYDFAYLTYGEICKRIIQERDITIKGVSADLALIKKQVFAPNTNNMLFKQMTFEGLKMLYLPFIAKLQILEKSHVGGITLNHLKQLEKEFAFLTNIINHKEAKLLKAEFYSRLADILYYKNSDLNNESGNDSKDTKNCSCTACHYYHKALSILLDLDEIKDKDENTITKLLSESVKRINDNYNMKYCTILARILSDWGNVFFSCDYKHTKYEKEEQNGHKCYICDAKDCNTRRTCYQCTCYICDANDCKIQYTNNLGTILKKYIDYVESEEKNRQALLNAFNSGCNFSKMEIAFAMYAISLEAYTKSNLHKRSAYQILKMLRLFKYYEIYDDIYIKRLSKKAIRSLLQVNEDLNMLEIKKRKKDLDKYTQNIPLPNILVDSEIHRVRIFAKELELKKHKTLQELKEYYDLYITSPYEINYSIIMRIYKLRLKAMVNYKAYKIIKPISNKKELNETTKAIFNVNENFLEKLIAETIFCFKEIIRLSKTIGETYSLNHAFMGSIHKHLAFWIREKYENESSSKTGKSKIGEYLEHYFGKEWEEQLSSYYEDQQALSHYRKCLEMHNEGRAYHNMIDNMCYLKDDYNDRSDHFSIAEERHNILNGKIHKKIEELEELLKNSKLHEADNYYEH